MRSHLPFLLAACLVPLGHNAIAAHRAFDATTDDFHEVTRKVPHAPKLLHLVYDHDGSPARVSPYRHLPAYVRAEKGGWPSFSFAWLGHSPLRFRDPSEQGAVVPPKPPPRWEWTPHRFRLFEQGRFYDWFLVRSKRNPRGVFTGDQRIHLVAHEGTWWLFERRAR